MNIPRIFSLLFILIIFIILIYFSHENGVWAPAIALEALILFLCLSERYTLEHSFGASIAMFFGGATLWIHLSKFMPGTYEEKVLASEVIMFTVLVGWYLILRPVSLTVKLFVSPRRNAAAVALVSFLLLASIIWTKGDASFAWAMREDSVWNTVTARFMLSDNGFDSAIHPHSSPLTAALMAGVMSFGRGRLPGTALLQADMAHVGELWLILTCILSITFLLIGSKLIPFEKKKTQFVFAILCSVYPWTWLLSGWAFQLGYLNATVSLVVLSAAWIVWINSNSAPAFSSILLSLTVLSQLATWAPLALIPIGLLILHLWKQFGKLKLAQLSITQPTRIIAGIISLVLVGVYLLIVSSSDLTREKTALSFDGGMFNFRVWSFLVAACALIIMSLYLRRYFSQLNSIIEGSIVIVLSTSLGLGYLILQRKDSANLWGYYPAKMGWIATTLIVIIAISLAAGIYFQTPNRKFGKYIALFAACGLAVSVGLISPPSKQDVFTPVNIALSSGLANNDSQVPLLSELAGKNKQFVVFQFGDQGADAFINLWLLQINSKDGFSPLRPYAYYLDPLKPEGLCEIERLSDESVSVLTRNTDLKEEINILCPGNKILFLSEKYIEY